MLYVLLVHFNISTSLVAVVVVVVNSIHCKNTCMLLERECVCDHRFFIHNTCPRLCSAYLVPNMTRAHRKRSDPLARD